MLANDISDSKQNIVIYDTHTDPLSRPRPQYHNYVDVRQQLHQRRLCILCIVYYEPETKRIQDIFCVLTAEHITRAE